MWVLVHWLPPWANSHLYETAMSHGNEGNECYFNRLVWASRLVLERTWADLDDPLSGPATVESNKC